MNHIQTQDTKSASLTASFGTTFWAALRFSLILIVICGVLYPLASTGLAQLLFPHQANGSQLKNSEGIVIGSELIGQSYTDPQWFQGRVSSIEYNAEGSGSNNYAPSNPELLKRMQASLNDWSKNNPDIPVNLVPIDLITNSGSGLDPHITNKAAEVQISRVSKLSGVSEEKLRDLIKEASQGRDLGIFGEPRVNVLKLNLALQKEMAGMSR